MTTAHRARGAILALLLVSGACANPAASPGGSPRATPDVTPSAVPSPAKSPSADITADLQALLDTRREMYGAPGGLALFRDGEATWSAMSGTADVEGAPITPETRFRIASITKPIVATLVLRAVDRGELSLDDVVAEVLPGSLRVDPPVTVRQLLNHTSGVFDYGNEGDPVADVELLTDPAMKAEVATLLERYAAGERVIGPDRVIVALAEVHPRYFAPGTGYHYSNTNYQLAAMVLEKVSGRSLSDLLRTDIVEPLRLSHTTIAPPDIASPELRGYGTSAADGSLVDLTDDLVAFGNGGNGGIISTADELLTIMQAMVSGDLLPAELVEDMKTPAMQSYGLGLATYSLTCGAFFGHEGAVNGTGSIAIVSDDGARGVVIALNLRRGDDPRLPSLADNVLCGLR